MTSDETRRVDLEWFEADPDDQIIPDKPLPPFCRACSEDEYVDAVEFGEIIDKEADVVSWPCETVALVAEVRVLRDQRDTALARIEKALTIIGEDGCYCVDSDPVCANHRIEVALTASFKSTITVVAALTGKDTE